MANILKVKLADYQASMRELLSPQEQKYFNERIDLSERKLEDQTSKWETNNFYHTPLVASLVILSKLQMDVADVEYVWSTVCTVHLTRKTSSIPLRLPFYPSIMCC